MPPLWAEVAAPGHTCWRDPDNLADATMLVGNLRVSCRADKALGGRSRLIRFSQSTSLFGAAHYVVLCRRVPTRNGGRMWIST
jgi:hypothetical protein